MLLQLLMIKFLGKLLCEVERFLFQYELPNSIAEILFSPYIAQIWRLD